MTDEEGPGCCTCYHGEFRGTLGSCRQQIFIAAVIVNPFYQGMPFAQLFFLNNAVFMHFWAISGLVSIKLTIT